MRKLERERRKYPRYSTEVKIYFRVHYSLKTKVKFQLIDLPQKYIWASAKISVPRA
jgi:hypothetical protein